MRPLGLPGPDIIWRTEMNRVFLPIPAGDDAHSGKAGRIKGLARRGQVEGGLDEAAVIFQTNIANQAQTGATVCLGENQDAFLSTF